MITSIKRNLINNIKNIPGWRTSRKIVVFESDDWGSLRIGSAKQLQELLKYGVVKGAANSYDRLDALESKLDLEALFEVLNGVKDKNGHPAVFTPFVNPCNPDFTKIEEHQFRDYYQEPFSKTLKRYGHDGVMDSYTEGIKSGLFMPEYHGREHVNVASWMKALQSREPAALIGFAQEFSSVSIPGMPGFMDAFRPTYYYENVREIASLKTSIMEGAKVFENLFNYKTTVFDAPNAIFHPDLEESLYQAGIRNIVLQRLRSEPDGLGGLKNKYYRFGQKNQYGQRYHMRNCMFEPRVDVGADIAMKMIQAAFRWAKPAIITTHRVNYVGGLSEENRSHGLRSLAELLRRILKTWPSVEFMSSADFAKLMQQS